MRLRTTCQHPSMPVNGGVAISEWSQVSCQGIALPTLFSGAESSMRLVTIAAGKQISGISAAVPVGSLMCSMQPMLHSSTLGPTRSFLKRTTKF